MDDDLPRRGRRDYDDSVPVGDYLEERLTRVFEQRLGRTRHDLRNDIAALAASATANSARATEGLVAVRADLQEIRRQLQDLPQLRIDIEKLKMEEAVQEARESGAAALRKTIKRTAWGLAIFFATGSSALVAVFKG